MRDAIDACGEPPDVSRLKNLKLEFLLVSSGVVTGADMLSLIRGSYSKRLAKQLIKGFTYPENPVATTKDTLSFAEYVVQNTNVRLSPQLEGQQHEQNVLAFARLAMFGVPPAHIPASLDGLKGLLTPPRNLFASDVAMSLKGLPNFHPASGRSPISLLPSENTFHTVAEVEREFRASGRVSWAAIHYGLDTLRDRCHEIQSALIAMGRQPALVLVTGTSASGKSTVVRRVAWEIHRAGNALVFEVVDPQNVNSDAWDEVVRLGELTGKPIFVVCDELYADSEVLEQLRRSPYARVIVFASAKSEHVVPRSLPVHVLPYRLAAVSESERDRLVDEMGLKVKQADIVKLSKLMQAGHIFALSLALRGSSLDSIAERMLARVDQLGPELRSSFLCLCACGVRDQGVPKRLLLRRFAIAEQLVIARDEGLMFEEIGDRLRSGHATLAATILLRSGADTVDLKIQLLQEVDIANSRERRFGLGLLKNGIDKQATELTSFGSHVASFMDDLAKVGDYLDLVRGVEVLDVLIIAGATELVRARTTLLEAMKPDRVRTGHDAVRFMKHADDYLVAFPVVASVFAKTNIGFGRNPFMRWVIGKGLGHIEQHREAVALNLDWLRSAGFPPSETIMLVKCICHANPALSADAQSEFAYVLDAVLNAIPLPPTNTAIVELLHAILEAIGDRIRNATLFSKLLNRLSRDLDTGQFASHPELLRHLATVAKVAGDDASRMKVLRLLLSVMPYVTAKQVFEVYLALLKLVPIADKSVVLAWNARLKKVDPAHAASEAREFVKALPPHLQPVP